jgi:hypothetical protein
LTELPEKAFERFLATFGDKYPKATDNLASDRDRLLAFYDFPAAHVHRRSERAFFASRKSPTLHRLRRRHLRTTNPFESTFATIRLRTAKTRNCYSVDSGLALMPQFAMSAHRRWRKLREFTQLADVIAGVKFIDGIDEGRISREAAASQSTRRGRKPQESTRGSKGTSMTIFVTCDKKRHSDAPRT